MLEITLPEAKASKGAFSCVKPIGAKHYSLFSIQASANRRSLHQSCLMLIWSILAARTIVHVHVWNPQPIYLELEVQFRQFHSYIRQSGPPWCSGLARQLMQALSPSLHGKICKQPAGGLWHCPVSSLRNAGCIRISEIFLSMAYRADQINTQMLDNYCHTYK